MWRSLAKNRGYSFLNIGGLAIGIACASLIFLWVEDEVNFDSVNVKKDRLYIVRENQKYDTYVFTESSTPGLMGPTMKAELPGVANTARTTEGTTSLLFSKGDKSVFASGKYADPSIFSMFTMPFVEGKAESAFNQVHSVVITESAAKKFFGDEKNVVGQNIQVDNKQEYTVTGVIKDFPANSSFAVEWLMPYKLYFDANPWLKDWGNQSSDTFVELKPGVDKAAVDKQIYNYVTSRSPGSLGHPFLFGMTQWHLYDDFKDGKQTGGGQIEYVHLFSVIAWIILFIACINFMNLATARSEKRAREVGVRKVLGAAKKLLVYQFIGEAIFIALVSTIVAVVIMALVMPAFNLMVQKQLSIGLDNPMHVIGLLLIALTCGLVAGSYPSLYLSSFNPVAVLKGLKLKDSGAAYIRKGLVVLQFTASIVLIISTIVVYQQIQHVKSRQLGFNKDNLVEMGLQGDMAKNFNPIKQEFLNTGDVANVAVASQNIIYSGNNSSNFTWDAKPAGSKVLVSRRYVSPDFFETSGMKLMEGRNLTVADTAIPKKIVITQSLAKLMGKGSAIGKKIHREGETEFATVVGVVNDYVYGNMYGHPDPVTFWSATPENCRKMFVRFKPGKDVEKSLASLQAVLKKYNPGYPFDYTFVDDQFNWMFTSEMLVGKLSRVFASLAIIISCLGLFGLAAYTAEKRNKEIGIRKVLGASVSGLARLLSMEFLQLVIVSCLVAFPVAYLLMTHWLKSYEYRIGINWWIFAISGITALIIALATISYQAVKAALSNPIKSLRSE